MNQEPTAARNRPPAEATPVASPPWIGWAVEPFLHPQMKRFLADPLALFLQPDTTKIKASRNRLTRVRYELAGTRHEWVVKEFSNERWGAFLKNSWRTSKAIKGWDKARALLARGIETPEPRLALERRNPLGLTTTSVLVVDDLGELVQLRQILKDLRTLGKATEAVERRLRHVIEKRPFVESLARFIRHMHDSGVLHRDLSGGNILVRLLDKGGWEFALVDINRAKVVAELRPEERLYDLERVNIDPADREFFFVSYARGSSRLLRLEDAYLRRVERYRRFRESEGSLRYKLTKYFPWNR